MKSFTVNTVTTTIPNSVQSISETTNPNSRLPTGSCESRTSSCTYLLLINTLVDNPLLAKITSCLFISMACDTP